MLTLVAASTLAAVAVALLAAALAATLRRVSEGTEVNSEALSAVPGLRSGLAPFLALASTDLLLPVRERAQRNLVLAGAPFGGITAREYLACNAAVATVMFVIGLLLMGSAGALGPLTLAGLLAFASILFWLGNEWLGNLVSERQRRLGLDFPYFLDLAVMTMEAGTSLQESIEIYVRETPRNPLTEELNSVTGSMRMGKTLQEALDDFQNRTTVEDIQGTLRAVKQGMRMGTPISLVLRDQAETLRFRRSQSAERIAEEIKVRMQGPAMLMMISVLLLILGPAFIEMFGTGVF